MKRKLKTLTEQFTDARSNYDRILGRSDKQLMTEQASNARNITYKTCGGSTISGQANITTQGQVPQEGDILRINTNSTGYGTPRTVMVLGVSPNNATNQQLQYAQCKPTCPNCDGPCFNWTTMQSCNGTTGDPDCVVSGSFGWPAGTPTIECGSCGCGSTPPNIPPSFNCDGLGNCSDPGTGNGQYPTMADCTAACPSCDTSTASPCAVQWWQNPNATWAANWINNRDCSNYNWPSVNLEQQALDIMNDINNYGTNTPNPQTGPFNGFQDIWDAGNNSGLINPHKNQFVGKMAKSKYSQCQKQACNC